MIGHRGAPDEAPENTFPSFEAALDAGAEALEFDVLVSADGVPVVSHDEDLRRTTGIELYVSRSSAADLRMLDASGSCPGWKSREVIPTLQEVLERYQGRATLFVELKAVLDPVIGFRSSAEPARAALPLLLRSRDVIVSSFDPSGCALVREASGGAIPTAHTIAPGLDVDGFASSAATAGAAQIHLRADLLNAATVTKVREAGLQLFVYTVNGVPDLERCRSFGVDGFFTDHPREMISRLRREDP